MFCICWSNIKKNSCPMFQESIRLYRVASIAQSYLMLLLSNVCSKIKQIFFDLYAYAQHNAHHNVSAHQIQHYLRSLVAMNPTFQKSFFKCIFFNVTHNIKKLCLRGKALSCCLEPHWLIITAIMRIKYCRFDVKP